MPPGPITGTGFSPKVRDRDGSKHNRDPTAAIHREGPTPAVTSTTAVTAAGSDAASVGAARVTQTFPETADDWRSTRRKIA
jgi:hypothetical protein